MLARAARMVGPAMTRPVVTAAPTAFFGNSLDFLFLARVHLFICVMNSWTDDWEIVRQTSVSRRDAAVVTKH